MANQSRREFFRKMSQMAIGSVGLSAFSSRSLGSNSENAGTAGLGYLQGGLHSYPNSFDREASYSYKEFAHARAFRFDIAGRSFSEISCRVPIHTIENLPQNSSQSIAVSRRSNAIGLVDWHRQREVKFLALPREKYFYGHGAFDTGGKHIVLTTYRQASRRSATAYSLTVFDVESFKVVDEIPFTTGSNHDIVHLGNDRFAVGTVNMPNSPHRLSLFNLKSKKFSELIATTPSKNVVALGHLHRVGNEKILATTVPIGEGSNILENGLIEFNSESGAVRILIEDGRPESYDELLSLASAENRVWLTAPGAKSLVVWNEKTNQIESKIRFDSQARSVNFLSDQNLVVVGTLTGLQGFNAKTLERIPAFEKKWRSSDIGRNQFSHASYFRI